MAKKQTDDLKPSRTLRERAEEMLKTSQADIARMSPLPWKHIDFLERHAFSLPKAVANGELRPLRKPNYEYDF